MKIRKNKLDSLQIAFMGKIEFVRGSKEKNE